MMKIDFHVHTKEGSCCSDISAENTLKELITKQIDGVVFTDHESIAGFLKIKNSDLTKNIKIFCGFEFSTDLGDMLCILPEEKCFNWRDMSAEELIKLIHLEKGVIGIAHPFRDISSIGKNIHDFNKMFELFRKVDFIETNNGRANADQNAQANFIADEVGLLKVSGSDSHSLSEIGICFSEIPDNIVSNQDLINFIQSTKRAVFSF